MRRFLSLFVIAAIPAALTTAFPTIAAAATYGNATVLAGGGLRDSAPAADGSPGVGSWIGDAVGAAVLTGGHTVFVDDLGAVRSVDGSGNLVTLVAAGTNGLVSPGHVAAAPDGTALIADSGANRVWKVALNGTVTPFAGDGTTAYGGDGSTATSVGLDAPQDVEVAADGTVFIADTGAGAIRKVATDGTIATLDPTTPLADSPRDLSLTSDGGVVVSEAGGAVQEVANDGTVTALVTSGAGAPVAWTPSGVWLIAPLSDTLSVLGSDGSLTAVRALGYDGNDVEELLPQSSGAMLVAAPDDVWSVTDPGLDAETPAVTGFTATTHDQGFTLAWTPSAMFMWQVRGVPGSTPPSNITDGQLVEDATGNEAANFGIAYRIGGQLFEPNQTYSFAVFVADGTAVAPGLDLEQWSAAATATATTGTDTTPPAAPTNVRGNGGQTTIGVTWTGPSDPDWSHVMVRMTTGDTAPATPSDGTDVTSDVVAAQPFISVPGLDPNTDYSFTVFEFDLYGNYSQASITALHLDTTPPGPVTSPVVTDQRTNMKVSWTNPTDADFAGVAVTEQSGDTVPTSPTDGWVGNVIGSGNATTFNTVEGSRITVALWTYDIHDNYVANPTVVVVDTPIRDHTPPPAPGLVSVTGALGGVTVHWTNPTVSDFDHMNIYWQRGNGNISVITYQTVLGYTGRATSAFIPITTGPGDYEFAAQAVDTSGNASLGPTRVVPMANASFTLTTPHITYGSSGVLSGLLSPSYAHGTIHLDSRPHGTTTWHVVTSTTYTPYGHFSFTIRPFVATDYRVTYDNGYPFFGYQKVVTVAVAQKVTLVASTYRAVHGTRITLSGAVLPAPSAYGYVYLQQLVGTTWKTISHVAMPRGGKVAFVIRPMTRGTFHYRLYRPATPSYLLGYSNAVALAMT